MTASNPAAGETFFGPLRFAFRHGRKFPRLVPNQQIGTDIISNARHFVTIHLKKLDPLVEAFDPPLRTDSWQEVPPDDSALLRRMDPSDVNLGYRPSNKAHDARWRKIKIKLRVPKGLPPLSVYAKTGYYAPNLSDWRILIKDF